MFTIDVPPQPTPTCAAGLSGWICRHSLLTLFVLIYVFEWTILVPLALESRGLLRFHVPALLGIAVGWAPALAAIIVTLATNGKAGVRDLFRRFLIARVNIVWYLVAVFGMALLILFGIGVFVALGGKMTIPVAKASVPIIFYAFAVNMFLGAIINTEEIAWRGVALPRLQATYSALGASLILAVPEGLSHLPFFFNTSIAFFHDVGIVAFMLFCFTLTIIYTWLFNNTRGSLLLVTLLHASQNTWSNLLSDDQAMPFYWTVALITLIAILLVAVFGPACLSRGSKEVLTQ